jgi:hypothetical protein
LAKVHNGLHHHISIVKTVKKHTSFGARTKKTAFQGVGPAEIGVAGSQNWPSRIFQLPQMEEWIALFHSSRQVD